MATTLAQLRSVAARYRVQSALIGASVAFIGFVVVGLRLRHSAELVRLEAGRLSATETELTRFRAAFSPSSAEYDLRLSQLADSLGIAIARDHRVALAQQVAARAEALGLSAVRVRFAPVDSAAVPRPPELATRSIAIADYALALECDGTLAAVLSLLGQLPPSVPLERLGAVRARGATQYRLAFAVFESSSGGGSQSSSAQLAELMSFAKPLSESLAATPVIGPTVTLSGDPLGAGVAAQPVVQRMARASRIARRADAPAWDVSATLIAGARRAALINGVLVSVGDAVSAGVTLTAVERDRVVLTDQKGAAHTIAVKEGER